MKHLSKILIAFVLIFYSCYKPDMKITSSDNSNIAKWTIMFYDDADFNYAYDPFDDFRSQIIDNDNVNVIILRDIEYDSASIYQIKEDTFTILKQMGELNMGDQETLSEFVSYSKSNFPAERYILAFYDHGGGWEGLCWDKSHSNDNLEMDEIQTALTENGGVDLLLNTAPCLMGAIESAYELRNCTDIYIGSENYSGFCWWFNTINDFNIDLLVTPDISNDELAENIINYIYINSFDWVDWDWYDGLTMSAIKVDKLESVIRSFNKICLKYIENPGKFISFIENDDFNISYFNKSVDLYELLLILEQFETDPMILYESFRTRTLLSEAVLSEYHGSEYPNAAGLSIYFPFLKYHYYHLNYTDEHYKLDFSENTFWDEIIEQYFNSNGKLLENDYEILKGRDCFDPV